MTLYSQSVIGELRYRQYLNVPLALLSLITWADMPSQRSWCLDWTLKDGYELIKWKRAGMALDFFFPFYFLGTLCNMWAFSSPTTDCYYSCKGNTPLRGKHGVLTTGPPGKSQKGRLGPWGVRASVVAQEIIRWQWSLGGRGEVGWGQRYLTIVLNPCVLLQIGKLGLFWVT